MTKILDMRLVEMASRQITTRLELDVVTSADA